MTIAHERAVSAVPSDLDRRRRLREAREEVRALREQEAALRDHLETLGSGLTVAEHRYAELHVAYVELLTHARAAVAAAAAGELAPMTYIQGHLEEIGLAPAPGDRPERLVAEGLATSARLAGGEER
ncbi:hypothetical protein [Actinomadura sp. WAC 06369]|uniref:hypothetical protein n=1 Tax=Actinomadura sp. WAC 06369 TaxID=2203193 RepID=UPI000F7B4058|nr:hypothetical protein [Actinomadura sp. WAC 06369]RSN53318.1 hypothetical protein DMH08_27695 [Actinomadura sp. WAC 06369]